MISMLSVSPFQLLNMSTDFWSRDIALGLVVGYGLGSPGLIPSRRKISLFSIMSGLALGPTQPPIQWVLGALLPSVKAAGA
jgi:hypothetical protein